MASSRFDPRHRPRELRRRVVLPARVRLGAAWSEACILNVSSRGLMIQATKSSNPGSLVELRRGHHSIVARVVWRDGVRAGLQVDDPLPVEHILTLSQAPGLQLTAADSRLVDRRCRTRDHDASRIRSRVMEFAGVAAIACALCIGTLAMLEEAFARPMAMVEAALAD